MLTTDAIEVQLAGVPSRRRRERRIRGFFFAAAATSVVISVAIVASLAGEAWTFISNVDPGSLTEIGWYPRRGLFDISTLFAGTLTVAGIQYGMLLGGAVVTETVMRSREGEIALARRALEAIA